MRRSAAAAVVVAFLASACDSDAALSDEPKRNESGDVVEAGDVGSLRLKVGDVFPGEEATIELAREGCIAEFDAFIGLADAESIWDITAIYPTEQTWDAINDREVLCGVFPVSDQATIGSAMGVVE